MPAEMTWAEGVQNTVYGPITFRWEKKETAVEYTLEVPCGTVATVYSPKGEQQTVGAGKHVFLFRD